MAYKILLVDDDKDISETLKHRLIQEGYEVVLACDGEEALVKVKEEDPQIIILDIMLPKKDGYAVLKEIREKFKDKWRPVIMISAKQELESVKACYDLEADHYLTKPCTVEQVLRGVKTMISLIPARLQDKKEESNS
ncbi:MAG: response regulator [Candidatus Omnitrophota bacterium]|nr:response regulator [Candidatus Omnitrophota bacterium]